MNERKMIRPMYFNIKFIYKAKKCLKLERFWLAGTSLLRFHYRVRNFSKAWIIEED